MTVEQQARDLLSRMGIKGAQSFPSGDLVELANALARAGAGAFTHDDITRLAWACEHFHSRAARTYAVSRERKDCLGAVAWAELAQKVRGMEPSRADRASITFTDDRPKAVVRAGDLRTLRRAAATCPNPIERADLLGLAERLAPFLDQPEPRAAAS